MNEMKVVVILPNTVLWDSLLKANIVLVILITWQTLKKVLYGWFVADFLSLKKCNLKRNIL